MITTLILDLDGPLLDGIDRHYQCYSDILLRQNYKPIAKEKYWTLKCAAINRRVLLQESRAEKIYDHYLSEWLQQIENKKYLVLDKLQNHVLDILGDWKKQNKKLILATMRNHPENLNWQLQELGLFYFFDEIVCVSGIEKLDGIKAKAVKERCKNLESSQTLWIGDTEADINAAKSLGIKVCAVTCGIRNAEFLSSLTPDYLYSDLFEFSRQNKEGWS